MYVRSRKIVENVNIGLVKATGIRSVWLKTISEICDWLHRHSISGKIDLKSNFDLELVGQSIPVVLVVCFFVSLSLLVIENELNNGLTSLQ